MGNEICFTVFWGGASPACPTGGPDPHGQNSAPSWEKQTKEHVHVIMIMCKKINNNNNMEVNCSHQLG